MRPKPILNQDELNYLADVIGDVERSTSGELRLMIVRRSSPAGHVLPVLWLVLACFSLLVLWYERNRLWFFGRPVVIDDPWWMIPVLLAVCAALAALGSKFHFVQRLFLTPHDMHRAVWTRAELEFHREGLSQTQGATGILLFLSLFERKAVVLADRSIAERLPPSTWDQVISIILSGARHDQWKSKLEEAIRLCGRVLAEHFPVQPDDVNELSNAVIVKD